MKGAFYRWGVCVIALSLLVARNAFTEDKSVTEQILDLLKSKGEISEQQYKELRDEARAEEEQKRAAQAKAAEKPKAAEGESEWVMAPIRASLGKFTLGGLGQVWLIGSDETPQTAGRLRRMEIKFSGEVIPKIGWTVMIDPAKALSVNQGPPVAINQSSNVLQDAFVTYKLLPELAFDAGQYKVPLSMEGQRSSAQLLTVERSIFNTLPARNGRVGDIRDIGLEARGSYSLAALGLPDSRTEFWIGGFNDSGPGQNQADGDDQKAFIGRMDLLPIADLRLGAYGATGGTKNLDRDRVGTELSYRLGPNLIEGEYVHTKDGKPAVDGRGWYALYGFRLTDHWQAVARYEQWDPDRDKTNDLEKDFTLGINWFISKHNAKIQLDWVHKDIDGEAPSFLGKSRELVLVNWQVSL